MESNSESWFGARHSHRMSPEEWHSNGGRRLSQRRWRTEYQRDFFARQRGSLDRDCLDAGWANFAYGYFAPFRRYHDRRRTAVQRRSNGVGVYIQRSSRLMDKFVTAIGRTHVAYGHSAAEWKNPVRRW